MVSTRTDLELVHSARCSTSSTSPASLWCLLFHHLQSTQHLHHLRVMTLTLGRLTWVDMVSTRTPTATWSRKWCLKTSASLTQRRHATPRIRNRVPQDRSETAPVLLKLMWRESAST